jgi:hypothetical protein
VICLMLIMFKESPLVFDALNFSSAPSRWPRRPTSSITWSTASAPCSSCSRRVFYKEITEQLGIYAHTVNSHLRHL